MNGCWIKCKRPTSETLWFINYVRVENSTIFLSDECGGESILPFMNQNDARKVFDGIVVAVRNGENYYSFEIY